MQEQVIRNRVRVRIDGQIARVSLNRPDKHNGLDRDMMLGLVEAARQLRKQREIRVVILSGEGESFCAGLDFPAMTKRPLRLLGDFFKFGVRSTNLFQKVCWCWRELPVPVIAVIHGRCYGGGLQIALAADFRFTTPDCEFSIMEIKWGLVPDMTGTVTLRELMPIDQAKLLAMTGRVINGTEARGLNLVTATSETPDDEAQALAQQLISRSPDAISACKELFQSTWSAREEEAFDQESRLQFRLLRNSNQREAMRANFERRPPRFKPRS